MEYDLTPKLAQYMDKHFVVHLLDHLQQVTSSPTNDNSQQADTNEEKNDGGSSEQDGDKNPDNVSLISQIPMKEDSNTNDQENGDGTKDDIVSFYSRLGVNEAMYQVLNGTFMYDEQVTTQANVKQLLDSIESLDPNSKSTSNSNLLLKKIATKEKIEQRKKNFLNKFSSYQEKCGVLLDAFSDNEEMINLFKDKKFTMTEFSERYGVTYKDLDNLYEYCRMRYEMGYYKNTDKLLNYFIELYEIDESKRHKAMFGKLAVEILEEKWQDAITDVEKIFSHIQKMSTIANRKLAAAIAAVGAANEAAANGRTPIGASSSRTAGKDDASGTSERKDGTNQSVENVENVENGDKKEDGANDGAGAGARAGARAGVVQTVEEAEAAAEAAKLALSRSAAVALREKAWLLHWSLFIYFNQNDGAYLDFLVDLFIDNMTTIETIAPHLLRYMAAAVLISDKNTDKLQKLVEISRYIDEEQYTYKDPITEFVRLVIRVNDFDGASKMLKIAYDICNKDFFLCYYSHYFLQYARLVFVRKYCRLFSVIDVSKLSKLLWLDHLSTDEIQTWVVNAIREIQNWTPSGARDQRNIDARLDVGNNVLYVQVKDTNPLSNCHFCFVQLSMILILV